jgi:hypothetical protein
LKTLERLSKKKTSNHICISRSSPPLSSQVFMKWWGILSELWRISWRAEHEDKREETQKATATFLATFILRLFIPLFGKRDFLKKKSGIHFSKMNGGSEELQTAGVLFCIKAAELS